MDEAIRLYGCVVEPGARAAFPFGTTDHAEFGAAATGHVVAAFFEFDGCGAVEAALPAFFFGDFRKAQRGFVGGAEARGVPFVVAAGADTGFAASAFPHAAICVAF